jgi:hypothetical protein
LGYQLHERTSGTGFNAPILKDFDGNEVDGAKEPMDPEIMQAMLALNVRDLELAIDDEIQRQAGKGLDNCMNQESKNNGLLILALAQTVLQGHLDRNTRPTLTELVAEMSKPLMDMFPHIKKT